jgi:hypothetical protein
MLPKEVGTLYAAIQSSTEATCDATRLGAELGGLAAFHKAVFDNNLLSPQCEALFQQHVGTWVPGRGGFVDLTSPAGGAPKVKLRNPVPSTSVPPVSPSAGAGSIICPHCGETIVLKT